MNVDQNEECDESLQQKKEFDDPSDGPGREGNQINFRDARMSVVHGTYPGTVCEYVNAILKNSAWNKRSRTVISEF